MKIAIRLGGLAVVAGLGCWFWTLAFPAPEKVVLRKISGLASTATFSASDSNFTRAAKVANLIGFFAVDAQISFDAPGQGPRSLSGRDEIRDASRAGFTGLTALTVQFLDVNVSLGADRQTADVSCTARVNAGNSKDYGLQEMHFQLKKIAGDWLITRAETVKTLS